MSECLNKSGFRAPVKTNIRDEIWIKLLGNVAFNPLSVLTGGTLEEMCKNTETRSIVEEIMIETKSIGEKLGANFPISIEKRINGAEAVGDHKHPCSKILRPIKKWNLMLSFLQFKNWGY